ncbi:MAG TPA: hypothetical protein VMT85_14560 [Thermoanaerobaculia bacterium]|nr:hypothetical protein [Thermoanaerobaculia bacterium]
MSVPLRLRRAPAPAALALLLALPFGGSPAAAQVQVIDPIEDLDFDDPESWAMKYFSSASLMTSLGPVQDRVAGELELGLEALSVPDLSEDQRTVGFGGNKEEDLNRSPAFGRIRLAVGLGGRFSLTAGWMPPVEVDGVEANLVSLAIERPIVSGQRWSLGWRLYGQTGTAEGDLVCTREDAASPPGSPGNRFGCQEPSNDEVTLEHYGAELVAAVTLNDTFRLHFGAGAVEHDLEFQIDAFTFDFQDRTLLLAAGSTVTATAGATLRVSGRLSLAAEVFYSPLDRRRRRGMPIEDPALLRVIDDELLNLRGMLRYRLR